MKQPHNIALQPTLSTTLQASAELYVMPHDMRTLSKDRLSSIYREILLSSDRKIVLLVVSGRKGLPLSECNQNIYCISQDGEVFWQVQAGDTIYERDSFVSLLQAEDGNIRADRFFGNEFFLNPETGAVQHVGWHK